MMKILCSLGFFVIKTILNLKSEGVKDTVKQSDKTFT